MENLECLKFIYLLHFQPSLSKNFVLCVGYKNLSIFVAEITIYFHSTYSWHYLITLVICFCHLEIFFLVTKLYLCALKDVYHNLSVFVSYLIILHQLPDSEVLRSFLRWNFQIKAYVTLSKFILLFQKIMHKFATFSAIWVPNFCIPNEYLLINKIIQPFIFVLMCISFINLYEDHFLNDYGLLVFIFYIFYIFQQEQKARKNFGSRGWKKKSII